MHKLEFTLKQHTPIIHFQHEQDGATLRATELKPKLDRFLIERHREELKNLIKKTSAGDEYLDYKVRILENPELSWEFEIERPKIKYENSRKLISGGEKFPNYFGDMGNENEKKHFVFNSEVKVLIRTLNEELHNVISKNFGKFIERVNFGSRQSKGFGAFWLENQNVEKGVNKFVLNVTIDLKEKVEFENFRYRYPLVQLDNSKVIQIAAYWELFSRIELLYKILRTGYNNGRGNYVKAPLFFYMKYKFNKDVKYQWDKRSIKQKFINVNELENQRLKHDNPEILEKNVYEGLLVRDLFGFATSSDWKYYKAVLEKKHSEIERFKSPITIKPYQISENEFKVFFFLQPINENYLGQEFELFWNNNEDDKLNLITPNSFSLSNYFKFIVNEYKTKLDDKDDDCLFGNKGFIKDVKGLFNNFKEYRNYA